MVNRLFLGIIMLGPLFQASIQAEKWDLANDWSDIQNPNGVWSYELNPDETATGQTTTVTTQSGDVTVADTQVGAHKQNLLPLHTPAWFGTTAPDFPKGAQPAWIEVDSKAHGICRSTGVSNLDFPAGCAGGHSPFLIRWTAPRDIQIRLSGAVWMLRDSKRLLGISIGKTLNNSPQSITILEETPIPYPDAGFTSMNGFTFSHAAKTRYAYNDSPLKNISLKKGESIWIRVKSRSAAGDDFVGIDMEINEIQ